MAFLQALSLFIFLLVNIIHAGPIHIGAQHSPSSKVHSEKYEITANLYSGKPDPKWTITSDDRKKNKTIDLLARDIEHYGQSIARTKTVLPSLTAYKGFTLRHIVNGKTAHEWILPKCKNPKLEVSLLKHTPILETTKVYLIQVVNGCEQKQAKSMYPA